MGYPDNFKGTLPGEDFAPGARTRQAQEILDQRHKEAVASIEKDSDFLGEIWDVLPEGYDEKVVARAEAIAAALRAALAPFRKGGAA